MSDIFNKIILFWSKNEKISKISEIFEKIPIFCKNLEFQTKQSFLPLIGKYYTNSFLYDINNFLANENNLCFHINTPYEKNNDIILIEGYLLITAFNYLIMEPIQNNRKNICKIIYVGNNYAVKEIKKYSYDEKILEDFICFRIILDKNIIENDNDNKNYIYDKLICVKKNKNDFNDINEIIFDRKNIIKNNYKYIEGNNQITIEDYEYIINLKKKLIEKNEDEIIYDEINKCYRKIIEILSNENDIDDEGDGNEEINVKKYVDELHNFIQDYENKFLKHK